MPETTKTGKHIFPIRDSSAMKKDGWFVRKTNTKGVSVRLARLKSNDNTVVQAYIFDSKQGWTMAKAKKWLKDNDINWIAALNENSDSWKGQALRVERIESDIKQVAKQLLSRKTDRNIYSMSSDDSPELTNSCGRGHGDKDDKDDKDKKKVRTPRAKRRTTRTPRKQKK